MVAVQTPGGGCIDLLSGTVQRRECSQQPAGESVVFMDDADAGNPLRAMFTASRVPWCPSCTWGLEQLDLLENHSSAAAAGQANEAPRPEVTHAGGSIWLHAFEYRFDMNGQVHTQPSPQLDWTGISLTDCVWVQ